ncbi:vWA domain-containing protein [Adhaeribacter rhizoryzae]|uniref:VWA domain-containing protein n=1 Tax=Adhaeribacter rhizoryzae TaxID=2607907 RepID=A0A5M6DQS7_9BACT|nr:vWA domain-containing protein [Adhaeribacter rhizoryzae]KAA5548599.1 VWA domain-containing protein [Adhaeribacter rhizoryzae]
MSQFKLLTAYSPWLVLVCLVVGALYSWALYARKAPWSAKLNYLLAFLRFAVVSFLCFLLLGPYLKAITNTAEKPTIVVALDNSQSVGLYTNKNTLTKTSQDLEKLAASLADEDFRVEFQTLDLNKNKAKPSEVKFDNPTTNLDELLGHVQAVYESRNLAGVVLLSDGIINKGKSPTYSDFNFTVYPVAVGDTVAKKDITVSSVLYNKIAYSGNKFPVVAEIQHEGFKGNAATVLLKENGKILDRKNITLRQDGQPTRAEFTLTATAPGKKHYEIEALPQKGEFSTLNNTKHAYLDIIKGKLTVLIAAAAPHPDIRAIRAAIQTNDNFETVLYIPGIMPFKPEKYDVAVLHQLPSRLSANNEALAYVRQKNIPSLYIVGSQTDLAAYNQLGTGLTINRRGVQTDEVTPVLNASFRKFQIDQTTSTAFEKYPPADVPFADFNISPGTEVILLQQVGRVKTTKPLLAASVKNQKHTATLLAEGIWQWRITEGAATENPAIFDKLMVSTVQLLTAQQNKKRLNVYPVQDEYYVTDDIRFEAEVYNAIYERIYGQEINLRITDEKNKSRTFSFNNGEGFSGLNIGNLPGGVYSYVASTTIEGKTEQDRGQFVVQELQLEALNALADHNLLFQLAQKTNSRLYYPNQLEQLQADILKADYKNIIYPNEKLEDLVNLKWLFFVLLLLVSVEWTLRKYHGSY